MMKRCNGSSRSKVCSSPLDLVIMMADRGISARSCGGCSATFLSSKSAGVAWCVGRSWRMDETYIEVHGQWMYLYRAVDKAAKQSISFSGGTWT
jgi:transposase-like protein